LTGKQLQKALDRAGMSQRGMAKEIGIAERSMRRYVVADHVPRLVELAVRCVHVEAALREAYQISHYGRGSMQDIDDVLERAIRGSTAQREVAK
jgi:hypothetical protein